MKTIFKKMSILTLLLIFIFPIYGCEEDYGWNRGSLDQNDLERTHERIIIDNKPGWFEKNPIPIHISKRFSKSQREEMQVAINYLNHLEAGLILEPTFMRQTKMAKKPPSIDDVDWDLLYNKYPSLNDLSKENILRMEFEDELDYYGVIDSSVYFPYTKKKSKESQGTIFIYHDTTYKYTWEAEYKESWLGFKKELIRPAGPAGVAIINLGGRVGQEGIDGAKPYEEIWHREIISEEENHIITEEWNEFSLYGGKVYLLPEHEKYMPTFSIFIHEVFHILGFGHIDDPAAVMYKYTRSNTIWPNILEEGMLKTLFPPS